MKIGKWMKEVVDLCVKAGDFDTLEKKFKKELKEIHNAVVEMAKEFPVPSI